MNAIKVYGLRRTGTNYLQWLLIHNIQQLVILVDAFAWKHGLPRVMPRVKVLDKLLESVSYKDYRLSLDLPNLPSLSKANIHYLLCIKDPYSWYLSMCNWRGFKPLPVERDKLELFFLWNYMALEYQKFYENNANVIVVRYEDLLSNIGHTMSNIIERFHLSKQTNTIIDTEYNVFSKEEFSEKRNYYISKKYLKIYRDVDFDNIRVVLDPTMMKLFGYKAQ